MSAQQEAQTQDVTLTSTTSEALPQAPEAAQSVFTSLAPMVLIFVVFYFLLIRPQEKKRKAQEQLVSTVKPGEEVLLHSGIYGKVVKVNENDNSLLLQVSKETEIKVLQSAIADIVSRKVKAEETTKSADTKPVKKGKK
jgi:preprotein translocase subunit YajC